ncbi:hypothetical protein FRC11_002299 [Ceratobasidium sp. 423]|nr:hypothetical protein FRC11_002299 [Ceratobasidium sp. 423]
MAKDGEPLGDKFYAQPLLIDSTEEHLAKVLSRLTTLSLDGMLVSWTSKTYSSLVELRLFCSYHRTPSFISEAQFHSVLKSCPQLRILEFSLSISKASDTGPDEPIPLNKLHTLVLGGGVYHWKPFLRAIAPGPNPLHLLMPWEDNEKWAGGRSYPIPDELTNFLARSSVTRLTLKSLKTCYQIFRLLRFTASVQKLALDEAYWEEPFTGEIDPSGLDTRVNTLYLLRSNVHMDGLRKLVKILNIQKLVCWGDCFISSQKGFTPVVRGRSVHREIEMLCPMVEFLDGSYPNPMGSRY